MSALDVSKGIFSLIMQHVCNALIIVYLVSPLAEATASVVLSVFLLLSLAMMENVLCALPIA